MTPTPLHDPATCMHCQAAANARRKADATVRGRWFALPRHRREEVIDVLRLAAEGAIDTGVSAADLRAAIEYLEAEP